MYRIVTHPGSAHKDDFLSACVLLATHDGAVVERREPTRADLDDAMTFVVDVGMEYDPARSNFDHHQDPALPCAFHLIMQHLGLHDQAEQVFVWYPHMSMMDVKGPYRAAKHLGVDTGLLFATSSPIEGYILSHFARVNALDVDDLLYRFMQDLGKDMITLIRQKMARLDLLKQKARVVPVKNYKAVVSEISEKPKLSMELYLGYLDDVRIVMSITPSVRGAGWEMLRLSDHAVVDFRFLDQHPAIRFVHRSGLLAKTHARLPLPELLPIACEAIQPGNFYQN